MLEDLSKLQNKATRNKATMNSKTHSTDKNGFDKGIQKISLPPRTTPFPQKIRSQMIVPGKFKFHQLFQDVPIAILEKAVKECRPELGKLKLCLEYERGCKDAEPWLSKIKDLLDHKIKSPTRIGLIGSTGAGKSSIINAIVGQRVVATSGSRACTAVVTEIAYNHDDDLHRAEIDFITKEEWRRECEMAIWEARDEESSDTEKLSALAKLQAVYPEYRKYDYKKLTIEELMNHKNVSPLGSVVSLKEKDADVFYQNLKEFIDSPNKPTDVAAWPLIQKTRIFVKAAALSTGAILVDLPGVQDSNVARGAIADKYMRDCSGIWIVTPIMRAVDDKTTTSIMGKTMRSQLRMDGHLSSISVICSKTDEISIDEARESFPDLRDELEKLGLSRTQLQSQITGARGNLRQLEVEKVRESFGKNDMVTMPSRASSSDNPIHHFRWSLPVDVGNTVTTEVAIDCLNKLRELKKSLSKEKKNLQEKIRCVQKDVLDKEEKIKSIEIEKARVCIKRRNESSRAQVRENFKVDPKDPEEEESEGMEDENQEIARDMSIFAVSSRAFQQLSEMTEEDDGLKGFRHITDTGIPEVQQHCRELTSVTRRNNCLQYLALYSSLLNSLSAWALLRSGGKHMTKEEAHQSKQKLLEILVRGEQDIHTSLDQMNDKMLSCIQGPLMTALNSAKRLASNKIAATVDAWTVRATTSSCGYGLVHLTATQFRAICRKSGIWRSHDWIAEIAQPIIVRIAPVWDRLCNRKTRELFDEWHKKAIGIYSSVHHPIENHEHSGLTREQLGSLKEQNCIRAALLNNIIVKARAMFFPKLQGTHRIFERRIQNAMQPAFDACESIGGKGAMKEYRRIMTEHVNKVKRSTPGQDGNSKGGMFHKATRDVDNEVKLLIDQVQHLMHKEAQVHFTELKQEYISMFDPRAGLSEKTRHQMTAILHEICDIIRALNDLDDPVEEKNDSDTQNKGKNMQPEKGKQNSNVPKSAAAGEPKLGQESNETNEAKVAAIATATMANPGASMIPAKRSHTNLEDCENSKTHENTKRVR